MLADPVVRHGLFRMIAARSAAAALIMFAGVAPVLAQQDETTKTEEKPKESPAERFHLADPNKDGWKAVIDETEVNAPNIPMGDKATIERILDEGKNRNQVMKHLEHLTKEIGPRLTGSSNAEKANHWCADQYKSWGLTNVQIEEWGTIPVRFDRGPSSGKATVTGTDGTPTTRELQFTTYSWSAGTHGPVTGPVVMMPVSEEAYNEIKSTLKGAWILMPEEEGGGMRRGGAMSARYRAAIEARAKVSEEQVDPSKLEWQDRIIFDGINGFISSSRSDRVITSSVPGWNKLDADKINPDIFVTICKDDYDFIQQQLKDKSDLKLTFDLHHTFTKGPISCYNTIAEIRGTTWPDQVVIVSGHLDSWDGPRSEGCTDNGTGTCTTLETARILMAAGAKPKRTIRFIDWTGEEQGLLGSKAYVTKHKDELVANVSACLVDDGGTNYDGGLPAADQMVVMLAAATAPVNNVFYSEQEKKYMNVNIRALKKADGSPNTRLRVSGGSDHMSFNAVGIPGFFWDETGRAVYPHTHHTQFDRLDQAIPEYLVQSSTCAAVTAYNLACAETLLPREIAPPPGSDEDQPRRRRGEQSSTPPAPAADAAKAPGPKGTP